jgi:hypothetical protein
MLIYSRRIIQFVAEVKLAVKDVLSKEIRLKVGRDRFYDRWQTTSYPIKVVVYNNKKMLGYFDPNFYEMGFHECLMHASKEHLIQVIRHEIAHYMTFILHGETHEPHGMEFKAFCKTMGWNDAATICIEGAINSPEIEKSSVFRKVQKLMALARSSNENEAELAMIKSQQLLLKHNIESKYIGDDEKVFLKRIMKQKKETAKMRAIAQILETFFVSVVYNRGDDHIYLEILGDAVNVEIAEYVADVLQTELDQLWKGTGLKGMVAKNSFFMGLAKGYCNKIQALKRDYGSETAHALLVIEKKLVDAREMAYQHLRTTTRRSNYDPHSSALGEKMGRGLTINPALTKSKNSKTLLEYLGWR